MGWGRGGGGEREFQRAVVSELERSDRQMPKFGHRERQLTELVGLRSNE